MLSLFDRKSKTYCQVVFNFTFRFPTNDIHLFTNFYNAQLTENDLLYGINEQQSPFSRLDFETHFTLNQPLIVVESLHRKVEVSPLKGTLEVYERFNLRNDGAKYDT